MATDQDKLMRLWNQQVGSTDFWVGEFHKNRDGSGVRNATFALGKAFMLYNVMAHLAGGSDSLPAEVKAKIDAYQRDWAIIEQVFLVPRTFP